MIDYKLNLMQILTAIGAAEGTIHEREWKDFGVSKEDQEQVLRDLKEFWGERPMTTLDCNELDIVEIDQRLASQLIELSLAYEHSCVSSMNMTVGMTGRVTVNLELVFYK